MINQWKNKTIARIGMQGKLSPKQNAGPMPNLGSLDIGREENDVIFSRFQKLWLDTFGLFSTNAFPFIPVKTDMFPASEYPVQEEGESDDAYAQRVKTHEEDIAKDAQDAASIAPNQQKQFQMMEEAAFHLKAQMEAEGIWNNEWDQDAWKDVDGNYVIGTAETFMGWFGTAAQQDALSEIVFSAAADYADATGTLKDFYETGPPGARTGRFEAATVNQLVQDYGLSMMDLKGANGLGVLDFAAKNPDIDLEQVFDVMSTAAGRFNTTEDPFDTFQQHGMRERNAAQIGMRRYKGKVATGHTHLQAKVFAFGGQELFSRLMGIDSGTPESKLTGDEINMITDIIGEDFVNNHMDDLTGATRLNNYMQDLLSGPTVVDIPADSIRQAARTLAESWRMTPMGDEEIDELIANFGAQLQASQVSPSVWGSDDDMILRETPDARSSTVDALRGTKQYAELYGNKPTNMSEEEWLGKFSGISSNLTGFESRDATAIGMSTGDTKAAARAGLMDKEARGGTWHRRMTALRRAFR